MHESIRKQAEGMHVLTLNLLGRSTRSGKVGAKGMAMFPGEIHRKGIDRFRGLGSSPHDSFYWKVADASLKLLSHSMD
jgi:hypothetical protein